ncbi:MAG: hypothetical protein Q9204_002513 [Flavoplaca sp. TL-2023a]
MSYLVVVLVLRQVLKILGSHTLYSFRALIKPYSRLDEFLCSSGEAQNHIPVKRSVRSHPRKRTQVAAGIELRILPLGDSITYGYQPADDGNQNNGYRLQLLKDLSGSNVKFVGSVRSGTMSDSRNEGHSGATIKQTEGFADLSLNQRPNVILIHIGTNDLNEHPPKDPYEAAPERLDSLLSKIIDACPDATILVARIIRIKDSTSDARVQAYNARIPALVAGHVAQGHQNIAAINFSSVQANDLADGLHPTNDGYAKMGDIWFSAIQSAASKGWIKAPVEPDASAVAVTGEKQECSDGLFWYPAQNGNQVATGVGHGGNGKFTNNWIASGIGHNVIGVLLVDLDGDSRADYLWIDPVNGALTAYLNRKGQNGVKWIPVNGAKPIASGGGPGGGVRLSDLDNDGKAEYLFVHDGGAIDAWFNGGPNDDGTWIWTGPTRIASGVPKANQDTIIFADINGDGRSDYLVKGAEGSLSMWLNTGDIGSQEITWIPAGEIATGLGSSNISLADISGDGLFFPTDPQFPNSLLSGRCDYLILDAEGGLSGYLNVRGQSETKPIWIPQGESKSIATGLAKPELVQLADVDGDGKADYCYLDAKTGALSVYYNRGNADTSVTGDGVVFADIDGKFLMMMGILTAYVNGGPSGGGNDGWIWYPQGDNGVINTGIGATREQIRLADINGKNFDVYLRFSAEDSIQSSSTSSCGRMLIAAGDKKVDYLAVNLTSGAVTAYLNGGRNPDANKGWVWLPQGVIATGIGRDGKGVHFADINGDNKADYIWISEKGEMQVYLNVIDENPAKFVPYNDGKFVATGVGGSRDEIRLADINGDNRADYIRIHHNDGSVDLWINQVGLNPANWIEQGSVATGVGFSGSSVKFGSLTNSGRADYIPVVPSSGAITPWLNGCKNPTNTPSGGETAEGDDPTRDPGNSSGQDGTEEAEGGREDGGALADGENETTDKGIEEGEADDESDPIPASGGVLGGASNGAGGERNDSATGAEPILLPPSLWTAQDPVIQCEPPCIFVLPPLQLPTATTISFPLYTTTLDVAWLTAVVTTASGGAVLTIESYTRTLQETVLTIPPGK